ncbi:GyrI-like domain-containing protein [Serratia oryzae]|uniref:Bacterial transcription activator effector binding domain-containing protein n=1 Tax=Serratia oryzae TaxID=2034155 RepID=A0A1S8CLA1_9GAMM|nr:hypothetical protein [Serratia oryzae]OMQ23738.1 hypothetical protein BMI79_09530 [Serratia oryzae]
MDYQQVRKAAFTVTGIRKVTPDGGVLWDIIKSDGSKARLEALSGKVCDIGLCFGFDAAVGNDYLAGVEGVSLEGFTCYAYPATTFLLFDVKGKISDGVLSKAWESVKKKGLPTGHTPSALPTLERYRVWSETADQCHVEIMIPLA